MQTVSSPVLVALTAVLTLESFRILFPVMYGQADARGNEAAAAMVLAVFAAGFLVPVARRLTGSRVALAASVGAVAGWRLAIPLFGHVPLPLAVCGAVAALLATTLVLTEDLPGGAGVTGLALLAGLGIDVAIRASFATWDPVWQSGPLALAVGAALAAALGLALVGVLRSGEPGSGPALATVGGGVAVGALLALEILFLLSPGFVASSAGMSLSWSALVVLGGTALAVGAFVATWQVRSRGVAVGAGVVLAGVGFLLPTVSGWAAVAAVLAAQLAVGAALAAAFVPAAAGSRLRGELGLATGWLVLALTVLLYQVHFDKPLPFGNRWVVAATGALAALAAFRPRRSTEPADPPGPPPVRSAALAAAALLVVGVCVASGLAATGIGGTAAPAPGASLRVIEWNVRQAVTTGKGNLDPRKVASVLSEGGKPDIVVLPEAARGWPLSGDLDLGAWLSRRLDLPFVWGPAADNQFGTLVLSRLPIIESSVDDLPVAGGQDRSVVRAELQVAGGEPLILLATHLQHRNDESAMEARMRQIDLIIREWSGARRTLLVGDLNPRQGDPPDYPARRPGEFEEIRAFLDAGFTTAHDLANCSEPTSGRNCTDFVLVSPDLHQEVSVVGGRSVRPPAGREHCSDRIKRAGPMSRGQTEESAVRSGTRPRPSVDGCSS